MALFRPEPPSDDGIKHFKRVLPHERVHAGFDGDRIVGGTGSFAFDLTIPGGRVRAAGYATDQSIVVKITDEFCPRNAGRWRVARGAIEKTAAEADLACDVASLGCVYLGGSTFAQLARSMRVKELRAGAIARADAMFHSDRAPWCPKLF